ncbi:MAG: CBS domain-containing protein [Solirubrobacteraceae bacterium]
MTTIPETPLAHIKVSDAMHTGILTTDSDTSLGVVARLMTDRKVHAVAVVDRGNTSRPWGIVSTLDIAAAVGSAANDLTAGEAAGTDVVTVAADVGIEAAAQTMAEQHLAHLIVVNPGSGQAEGILSALDVTAIYGG